MIKISFIVLTYNRADALIEVLRSLSAQCDARHEVLIADDGSVPEQVQLLYDRLPRFQCPVVHIWHPDVGFTIARARNLAVSHAKGEYLVFLDGDCIPNKTFVMQHARLTEPGYFVNGSRVLLSERLTARVLSGNIDLPNRSVFFWLAARLRGDCNKLLHLLVWPRRLLRIKQSFQWRRIRGCNLAVWRRDFVSVNGFDETFHGWGHEDADFVLRLSHFGVQRKNGFMATEVFHLWHCENARVYESINKQKVIQRMKTDIVSAEKGLREIGHDASVKVTPLH
jgi:GT2 family glycosyltransferase